MNQTENGSSILVLLSSANNPSISTDLALDLAAKLSKKTSTPICTRHLSADPMDQTNAGVLKALHTESKKRSENQKQITDRFDEAIYQTQVAHTVIIAAPMYNFMVPSQLKAWFDAIARAGVTFSYNQQGVPVGHLTDKKVYIIQTAGGVYEDDKNLALMWLKQMCNFLGMSDIEVIKVHGLNMGLGKEATEKAREKIQELG